jgi:hypothetical protein
MNRAQGPVMLLSMKMIETDACECTIEMIRDREFRARGQSSRSAAIGSMRLARRAGT